jgi:phosphatidylinositol glycan class T
LLIITDNPIPRPVPIEELPCDTSKPYNSEDTCYPLDKAAEPSWSLAEVFGRPLKGACPLTNGSGDGSETVCINVPMEREVQVRTSGTYVEVRHKDGLLRCYKLPSKCIILEVIARGEIF